MHKKFYSENLKVRDCLRDLLTDGSIALKIMLKKWSVNIQSGFVCCGKIEGR
jgi:hypothetical protein